MRNREWITVTCLALLLAAGSGPALALRCGNELVSDGDLMIEVRRACGEPDSVQEWSEVRHAFRWGRFWPFLEEVKVVEWIYNFGPSRFIYIVRFENGRVEDVDTGDYGF